MSSRIILQCVKQGSKLRVRFHSFINDENKQYTNVYDNTFNCQFPKNIREDGRFFEVGPNDVQLCDNGKQPFYRISTVNIKILSSAPNLDTTIDDLKMFTLNECVVCMEGEPTVVLLPCGHVCTCSTCFESMKNQCLYGNKPVCPLCRRTIIQTMSKTAVEKAVEEATRKKLDKAEELSSDIKKSEEVIEANIKKTKKRKICNEKEEEKQAKTVNKKVDTAPFKTVQSSRRKRGTTQEPEAILSPEIKVKKVATPKAVTKRKQK